MTAQSKPSSSCIQSGIPGHRYRPRDLQADRGKPRRPHLGGLAVREGRDVSLHRARDRSCL